MELIQKNIPKCNNKNRCLNENIIRNVNKTGVSSMNLKFYAVHIICFGKNLAHMYS